MGNKRKAIHFIIAALLINILLDWMDPPQRLHSHTYFDYAYLVIAFQLLVGVGFLAVMASQVSRDIEGFKKTDQTAVPVKWTMALKVFVIVVSVGILFNTLMFYVPVYYGKCPFPSFQDIVYRYDVSQRSGIEKVLLNVGDLGCVNSPGYETLKPVEQEGKIVDGRWYSFAAAIQDAAPFHVDERVVIYEDGITQEKFEELAGKVEGVDDDLLVIALPDNLSQLDHSRVICTKHEIARDCWIYLAHGKIFVRLLMDGENTPEFNELAFKATEVVANRLLHYQQESD